MSTQLWVTLDFKAVGTITLHGGSGSMPRYNMGDFGVSRDQIRVNSALHDLEHAIAALEALVTVLPLAQLVRALGAAEVLGHPWVAHQPLEQRQITASPGLEGYGRGHSAEAI